MHANPVTADFAHGFFFLSSTSCAGRTQAHDKDLRQLFVYVAFGIGIGIAFGIEIAIEGYSDIDADGDPDSVFDPGISRYHLYYFRNKTPIPALQGTIPIIPGRLQSIAASRSHT